MGVDNHIRRGHPVLFFLLMALALVEACIASWVTARYNQRHDYSSIGLRDRVRFLVFTSWWTVIGSFLLGILFLHSATGGVMTSIASHGIFLFFTWLFWLAGAIAITVALGGGTNCSTVTRNVVYCNQLNALIGFAWACWIITTILLLAVLIRGITSLRRGEGARGQLVNA